MMKLVLFSALVAVTVADVSHLNYAPSYPQWRILRLENEVNPDGTYHYAYDTENGISANEQGTVKQISPTELATSAQGGYQYTSPEGVPVQIQYIADEYGFRPVGNVLPTPPPTPEAILRALRYLGVQNK